MLWSATILLAALLPSALSFHLPQSPFIPPLIRLSAQATESVAVASTTSIWKWRNYDIFTEAHIPKADTNSKPTVILLHGFGASTTYFRETISTLHSNGYPVHALDLLGQGRSSKPLEGVDYSINLWAEMVDDYASVNNLGENGVVLMGNSLGSLVALAAATGDFSTDGSGTYIAGEKVKGICLFNCAIGLNSRNVLKNPNFSPLQRTIFGWIFDILNALIFDNEVLLRYALNNVVTKELLCGALQGLYLHSPERVDEELVDSFYYPAIENVDGAVEAIRQIYTNDAGLTPMEMHGKYPELFDRIPLHLIWGNEDVVTPITGDVGTFYCDRVANNRSGRGMTTIDIVKSGHMPFDDNPVVANEKMINWLEKKVLT